MDAVAKLTWDAKQALASYRSLLERLPSLSEEEVLACLALEAGTRRRRSIMNRLIIRAARIREQQYVIQLKERFK